MGEGFIFTEEVWIERSSKNEFRSLLAIHLKYCVHISHVSFVCELFFDCWGN